MLHANCLLRRVHVRLVNPILAGNLWLTTQNVKRAFIRVLLLTGTYYLQKDRMKFKHGSAIDVQ